MTMRQISPTKKLEKIDGWEPPHLEDLNEAVTDQTPEVENQTFPDSLGLPLGLSSWASCGLEEDSSSYANLDSKDSTAVRWTARAKGKLACISRRSRGVVSESPWEGFK